MANDGAGPDTFNHTNLTTWHDDRAIGGLNHGKPVRPTMGLLTLKACILHWVSNISFCCDPTPLSEVSQFLMDDSIVQAMEEPWVVDTFVPEFRAPPPIGVPVPLPLASNALWGNCQNEPKGDLYTKSKGHLHS
jgi:hypothetical protein